MLRRYSYTLTATKPVSAGESDQRSNVRRAHDVVPGATLRGALGAQWWRSQAGLPDAERVFEELFERDLLVGQAVPDDLRLLSASARVCKYRTLPACASVIKDDAVPGASMTWKVCWSCGGPLAAPGAWARASAGPHAASGWVPVSAEGRRNAMVARTRGELTERETAADGKLFTRHAIVGSRGRATFKGFLCAPEEAASWLNGLAVRLGGVRSNEYGISTLTLEESPWPALPDAEPILIRLVSPAILVDDFGGADISERALRSELRRATGVDDLQITTRPAWLRSESVSGWHMRSRLPKMHDWALASGTVALVAGLTAEGWGRLERGIGLRTLEGYGQVEIVDPSSLPTEPINEGVGKLKRLRQLVPQNRAWGPVARDLRVALEKMKAATTVEEIELIRRSAGFPGLLGEAAAAARAVLSVPPGHLEGTIATLKEMK